MKKSIVILVAALIGAAGFVAWKKSAAKKLKAESVSKVTVTQGPIEQTVDATGGVEALNRVEIKPPISGRIENLLVVEGDKVKSGQILAWMSSSDRAAILDAARAQGPQELKQWKDDYKPTPIVAPLSGIIILKNVVVGQTVDASSVLYAMADRLIVKANVDEADIGRVKIGLPARITLDAYPDQPVDGNVFQILYEGKNVSNVITYGVKVQPDLVPLFFRSQMTANVSLILEKRDNALLIPAAAVKSAADGSHVMVSGPNGKPTPKPIVTGLSSNGSIEIVSGLSLGDEILIMQNRYTPQKAVQGSPLTMGGSANRRSAGSNGSSRTRTIGPPQ